MNEIKPKQSKIMSITNIFLWFDMKFAKALLIKKTNNKTERNIIILLLITAISVLPAKVATYTPAIGARIPNIPKKTVIKFRDISFIFYRLKNNTNQIYKHNPKAGFGKSCKLLLFALQKY